MPLPSTSTCGRIRLGVNAVAVPVLVVLTKDGALKVVRIDEASRPAVLPAGTIIPARGA